MNATRQMTAAQNTGCRQQRLGARALVWVTSSQRDNGAKYEGEVMAMFMNEAGGLVPAEYLAPTSVPLPRLGR